MESNVADVLAQKGREVHTATPTENVRSAVARMMRHGVGALVVHQAGSVVGLLSERDLLSLVLDEDRPAPTPVGDVMTRDPVVVRPTLAVPDAMLLMTERRTRHLPVVAHGQLAGMISIGDLTKWVTRDLQLQCDELERFIHGPYATQDRHA